MSQANNPPKPPSDEQPVPSLAELNERAKKLDEEVRRHLEALKKGKNGGSSR
jgi:hypothetical protein